jgi:putative membrane protein
MMFWYDHGVSGWGWFVMSLGMVVFWGLLITGFVLLFRSLNRPSEHRDDSAPKSSRTAEQLLAERFARGEIGEEEYRHRLHVLHGGG